MNWRLLIGSGLLLAAAAAHGTIGMDMLDLPKAVVSDEDRAMMREALVNALETQPDNVTSSWSNPKTGTHGIIRPVATFERDGMRCRKLRARNTHEDQSNEWVFNFCKTPEGEWKIAP